MVDNELIVVELRSFNSEYVYSNVNHPFRRAILLPGLRIFPAYPDNRLLFFLNQRTTTTAARCTKITTGTSFDAIL
jgi:hypothetical protein